MGEHLPTSHCQSGCCMGKADMAQKAESRVSDTVGTRADRHRARRAARRITPRTSATRFDMGTTGAWYLADIPLNAWEWPQAWASDSRDQNLSGNDHKTDEQDRSMTETRRTTRPKVNWALIQQESAPIYGSQGKSARLRAKWPMWQKIMIHDGNTSAARSFAARFALLTPPNLPLSLIHIWRCRRRG